MYRPGPLEWVFILLVVLILFGAGKLPEVGRSLGTAITEFKSSVKPKDENEPSEPAKKDKEDE